MQENLLAGGFIRYTFLEELWSWENCNDLNQTVEFDGVRS